MTKKYYEEHKDEIIPKVIARQKTYRNTPMGRAVRLANNYKNADRQANREEGNITAQWIVENIFTKPCVHCGKEGWQIIGCNRLDNSKPHTIDNVEPCCEDCNSKLYYKEHQKMVGKFTLGNQLVEMWSSLKECKKQTNIGHGTLSACCNNKYLREGNNVFKGYIWKYINS
jgi:hypothetical protein